MREALSVGQPNDLGGKFYLYLGDLWSSKHEKYLGSIKSSKLGDIHQVAQTAITDRIKVPSGKFEIFCAEKQDVPHTLTRKIKWEGAKILAYTERRGGSITKVIYLIDGSTICIPNLVLCVREAQQANRT